MDWLQGEPSLDEILSDPIVWAVMRRDAVEGSTIRSIMHSLERAEPLSALPASRITLHPAE